MRDAPDAAGWRRPLDAAALHRLESSRGWRQVRLVSETASTNADLVVAAATGDVAGHVLVAEHQTAGRGRLGRSWVAPHGTGLTFSVAVATARPAAELGWVPLLCGLAVADAVDACTGVGATVKWPNDVVVSGRKLAGILAERVGSGGVVVVGVGLNVSLTDAERPVAEATSLLLEGASPVGRTALLGALLGELAERLGQWEAAADVAVLRDAYRSRCSTIGREVVVEMPGGATVAGLADDVDAQGRLVVVGVEGRTAVSAGDVHHVR